MLRPRDLSSSVRATAPNPAIAADALPPKRPKTAYRQEEGAIPTLEGIRRPGVRKGKDRNSC